MVSLMKPICSRHRLLLWRVRKEKLWPLPISCQPKTNGWRRLTLCVMILKRHLKVSWITSLSNSSSISKQKESSTSIWEWLHSRMWVLKKIVSWKRRLPIWSMSLPSVFTLLVDSNVIRRSSLQYGLQNTLFILNELGSCLI